eukprot:365625-Chlamydomonas_euryale.AAC.5
MFWSCMQSQAVMHEWCLQHSLLHSTSPPQSTLANLAVPLLDAEALPAARRSPVARMGALCRRFVGFLVCAAYSTDVLWRLGTYMCTHTAAQHIAAPCGRRHDPTQSSPRRRSPGALIRPS